MENSYKTLEEMVKIFREKYSSKLPDELEKAAAELAEKLTLDCGYAPSPTDEDEYDEYEYTYNLIIKVCRKSLIDGFPIEDYANWEVPYGDEDGVLMSFVNKNEWGTGENYNPKCRCIDFWCQRDFDIAIPLGMAYIPEEFPKWNNVPFETCGEAIYYADDT